MTACLLFSAQPWVHLTRLGLCLSGPSASLSTNQTVAPLTKKNKRLTICFDHVHVNSIRMEPLEMKCNIYESLRTFEQLESINVEHLSRRSLKMPSAKIRDWRELRLSNRAFHKHLVLGATGWGNASCQLTLKTSEAPAKLWLKGLCTFGNSE